MKYETTEQQTLLEALQCMAPESSKTTLRSWLRDGRVTVDGQVIKISAFIIKRGQEVALGARPKFAHEDVRIYYEDKHIVAIEKPTGLLSVATDFQKEKTAHAFLKNYYRPGRVFVVHRIDQDTSGVMLFALTEEARDLLKAKFEKHDIERVYIAIVEGKLPSRKGSWRSRIYEDELYKVHTTDDPHLGQEAITHYEVIDFTGRYSVLQLTLETGRKNQIRVHCQAAGHPVVGDRKYGASGNPIQRLALHAHLIAFKHPITDKYVKFISPVPQVFQKLVSFEVNDATR